MESAIALGPALTNPFGLTGLPLASDRAPFVAQHPGLKIRVRMSPRSSLLHSPFDTKQNRPFAADIYALSIRVLLGKTPSKSAGLGAYRHADEEVSVLLRPFPDGHLEFAFIVVLIHEREALGLRHLCAAPHRLAVDRFAALVVGLELFTSSLRILLGLGWTLMLYSRYRGASVATGQEAVICMGSGWSALFYGGRDLGNRIYFLQWICDLSRLGILLCKVLLCLMCLLIYRF